MTAAILEKLSAHLPNLEIQTEDGVCERYGHDWCTQFVGKPCGVAFVRSAAECAELIKFARQELLALVPSGGRTGLSGGAAALSGELVVSFDKLKRIYDYNPVEQSVVVEAGVITEVLQDYAKSKGLFFPVTFASRGSSQIGGNIATNAGGVNVLRYGLMRDWILGLTVVTGEGEILHLNRGLVKNATGYDLRHLFIGSEGTLGFIIDAVIQLTQPPASPGVMVMAVPEPENITKCLPHFQAELTLSAFEFFSENALQHVLDKHGLKKPFTTRSAYYVLMEFENTPGAEEILMQQFTSAMASGMVLDASVSQSDTQAAELWRLREDITESIAPFKPYKNDISVRVSEMPAFIHRLREAITARYPDFEIVLFGHIGDGNLHLNILKPDAMAREEFIQHCESVNDTVFTLVSEHGGSISAEHGIGLLKKPYLHYSRSAAEIAVMKSLKRVFDPDNIMNPGKLL